MSVNVWEMLDSMSGSISNESESGEVREVKRRYLIGPTLGFNNTVAEIELYAPSYVESDGSGIYWVRKRLEVQGVGNSYFDCTATYQTLQTKKKDSNNNNDDGGNPVPGSVAWDTTGHTEHKTQALAQSKYPNDAPSFSGAINVSGNSVNGIDVVSPGMKYSETWIMPIELAMSCDYIGNIYSLTGTVNESAFRCFDPFECLFLGARGQWQGDQPYVTVTFDFEARPNMQVNVPTTTDGYEPGVGEVAVGGGGGAKVQKDGWQHLWYLYKPDVNNNAIVQKPVAAYIDTIYHYASWSALRIGRAPAVPVAPVPAQAPNAPGAGP